MLHPFIRFNSSLILWCHVRTLKVAHLPPQDRRTRYVSSKQQTQIVVATRIWWLPWWSGRIKNFYYKSITSILRMRFLDSEFHKGMMMMMILYIPLSRFDSSVVHLNFQEPSSNAGLQFALPLSLSLQLMSISSSSLSFWGLTKIRYDFLDRLSFFLPFHLIMDDLPIHSVFWLSGQTDTRSLLSSRSLRHTFLGPITHNHPLLLHFIPFSLLVMLHTFSVENAFIIFSQFFFFFCISSKRVIIIIVGERMRPAALRKQAKKWEKFFSIIIQRHQE